MQEITFEAPFRGQFACLSPNGCMLAVVKNSLHVLVYDYTPATSTPPLEEAAREHGGATKKPGKPQHQHQQPHSKSSGASTAGTVVKVQHQALDQVTALEWSPDSALLALLMVPRTCVEIVSVVLHRPIGVHASGVPSAVVVARVDGGLNGILCTMWHPSSRVLYFFGACRSHGLSLNDGTTMQLLGGGGGGVKISRRSAQRLLAMSKARTAASDDPSSVVNSADAPTPSQIASTAMNDGWWEGEPDATPLLRFSCCRRFFYCVTPRQMQNTTTSTGDNKDGSSLAMAYSANDSLTTDGVILSECIVALCASTHKILHAQDLPSFTDGAIQDVAALHVTACGVVLFDLVQGNLAILSLNLSSVLRLVRGENLISVAVSSVPLTGGRTVAANSVEKCFVLVAVGPSADDEGDGGDNNDVDGDPSHLLRSFRRAGAPFACLSFPLKQRLLPPTTPILVETPSNANDGRMAPPTDAESFKENVFGPAIDAHTQPPKVFYKLEDNPYLTPDPARGSSTAGSISGTSASDRSLSDNPFGAAGALVLGSHALAGGLGPVSLSGIATTLSCFQLISVSPTGRFVAVVPPHHPHCVALIDVIGGVLHSVLKHSAVVIHCAWARPPRTLGTKGDKAKAPVTDAAHEREVTLENLAITTDTHDGIVFFWRPDSAMAAGVPPIVIRSNTQPQHATRDVVTMKGVEVGMRVNRVLWSDANFNNTIGGTSSGRSLVLCDDLRGTCVSASMES